MVWSLRRGIRLEKHHPRSLRGEIRAIQGSGEFLVPLYGGEESSVRKIQPGDHVERGTALTAPGPGVPAAFAPVSGLIRDFRPVELPLDGTVICAVLEPDPPGGEKADSSRKNRSERESSRESEKRPGILPVCDKPDGPSVLKRAREAGIVDEFDGTPLDVLLERFQKARTRVLVACGLDDDPYADSSGAVLREQARETAEGLRLAALACGVDKLLLAAPSFYVWRKARRAQTGVSVVSAGGRTPAKGLLARRLRKSRGKAGFVGAQACAALYRAVREGMPPLDTVVTVAGDGVWRAYNFRVPVGMPLQAVLENCGLYKDVSFLYVGETVSGKAVTDLSLPVTARTRCITVLKQPPSNRTFACIGCGRCTSVCVQGIYPWLVHDALNRDSVDPMMLWNVNRCTGCAACSAACPAGIDLAEEVARAAAIRKSGDFD